MSKQLFLMAKVKEFSQLEAGLAGLSLISRSQNSLNKEIAHSRLW